MFLLTSRAALMPSLPPRGPPLPPVRRWAARRTACRRFFGLSELRVVNCRCAAVRTTGLELFTVRLRKYAVSSTVFEPWVTTIPLTSGSLARISLMRFASVSQFSTVMLLLPTRMTSSTSSRATFLSAGIASATSPAWRRPEGVLAMVPPVATTLISGSLSWECAAPAQSANARAAADRSSLLPGPVVDGVLVGRARHGHVPLHRPAVGIAEALVQVRLRRGVQQAPGLQLVGLQ